MADTGGWQGGGAAATLSPLKLGGCGAAPSLNLPPMVVAFHAKLVEQSPSENVKKRSASGLQTPTVALPLSPN